MARTALNTVLLMVSRRMYGAAPQVRPVAVSGTKTKIAESNLKGEEKMNEKVFWMRDPKTGNWVPENSIGEVDVVELREKLLPKKP